MNSGALSPEEAVAAPPARRVDDGGARMHLSENEVSDLKRRGDATAAEGEVQFVTFAVDDEQYGVEIMAVREIKGWSEIKHLPKQPDYVRGVLNLRGVMVPIIDLRCRFAQGLTEATPVHVVIVVQIEGQLVGLLADRVLDIVSFDAKQIQPVPRVSHSAHLDFLSGLVTIENSMIALIDLSQLFSATPELKDAAAAA
jgi:purine-binding chemotaxis protein CheW